MKDAVEIFKELDLHGEKKLGEPDHDASPFIITAKLTEPHKQNVNGCAFNQYINAKDPQCVATVGANNVSVYEVPKELNTLDLKMNFKIDPNEDLYTVCWCFDTYESEKQRCPYRIVAGGLLGVIYVFDPIKKRRTNVLECSGNVIYDMRTSPANSNLVVVGTDDQAVRVFHIRNSTCLMVMGGMHGHNDEILSVDWEPSGKYILSCGFDHQVVKWDISRPHLQGHLEDATLALSQETMNILTETTPVPRRDVDPPTIDEEWCKGIDRYNVNKASGEHQKTIADMWYKPNGCTYGIPFPSALNNQTNWAYVDCVRALPSGGYYLTKQAGDESYICLWRFGVPGSEHDFNWNPHTIDRNVVDLARAGVPAGLCWFTKFEIDPKCRWVAAGGIDGALAFFDLHDLETETPPYVLNLEPHVLRQVSFSPCGRLLVVVGDNGLVTRMDRVSASTDTKTLQKFGQK